MVWSVSALVHAVSDALASRFAVCVVRGELSGFARAGSGHCYFSLKDVDGGDALIRCAMFRRAASLINFSPADGQLVELRGRLAVYEPRGELQFVVESMQRAGDGALFEQFLRLKAKLEAEGCFAIERKRALSVFPRRIGVVTSLGAAALHDVASVLARRAPHVEVFVYPSPVQGAEAPSALASAIAEASRRAEVDTLIVCRGGGSLQDLWAFNDERVVRALMACSMPVVCGVGHETDVTLADFAADVRAPTPTAAAELAVPVRGNCVDVLAAVERVMQRRVHHLLEVHAQRLDATSLRLTRPADAMRRETHRLSFLRHRLSVAAAGVLGARADGLLRGAARLMRAQSLMLHRKREQQLAALGARLSALDPQQVLNRGYAWLTDAQGQPVLSVQGLEEGQSLTAVLADGQADVAVQSIRSRGTA
jgi:exodeoxyribonuclease VII large subunit